MKYSRILQNLILAVVFAGGYFLLGKLGLNLATLNLNTSPIWPASGFAAGVLIVFGIRFWPAIFIASFLVNYTIHTPAFPSAMIALGNTLEAVLAGVLFIPAKHWFNRIRLRRIAGAVAAIAAIAPLISAIFGTYAMSLVYPDNSLLQTAGTWWCGNFLGILFVLPLVLILVDHDQEWSFLSRQLRSWRWFILIAIGTFVSTLFLDFIFLKQDGAGFIFGIFPLLLFALRGTGIIGLRLMTLMIFAYAGFGTYLDRGPFALGATQADYFQLQIFMTVFAVSSLSIGELYRSVRFRNLFMVLTSSWLLSGVIFYSFYEGLVDRDEKRFHQISDDLTNQFQQKFNLYENVLRAGAARLTDKEDITPERWKGFVDTLEISLNYPGLNGLAILYEVPTNRLDAFATNEEKAYKGRFTVHQVSENVSDRQVASDSPNQYVMTHVEPREENFKAHGMNITSDPRRMAAVIASRETGKPSVSETIQLVQDQITRKGYAMMYPVKKFKSSKNITGAWIIAPYAIDRVVKSMENQLMKDVNFWLVETNGDHTDVLYSSKADENIRELLHDPTIAKRNFSVGQKQVTVVMQRNPAYFDPEDYFLAWMGALAALLSLMIAWMYVDIYSFKERAEDLAAKKTKELSRREHLWLTVMKAAPVGFFHLNSDGHHIYRNAKTDEMTGMNPDELYHLQRIIGDKGPTEFPIVRTDREPVWVKGISAPIHNEEGEVTGTVGILVDITEQRLQEEQLESQRLRSMQAAKMATLGEMAGGIAHEINNPLAIISARAQMLNQLSDRIQPSMIRDYADKIEQTVQRIASIVRGMRTFSRNGENDPTMNSEMRNIINDTLEFCRGNLTRHGIELQVNLAPDLVLECRPTQISQVILNLINNAQDAVQNYDEKWIRIDAFEANNIITLRVIDSGHGIPRTVAEKMMQPFFTTKEVGKGTGLGLSISRGIIEDHHGRLYLDETSANTCFVIELPAAIDQSKVA